MAVFRRLARVNDFMQVRTIPNAIVALALLVASNAAHAQTDPGSLERTIPKFEVEPVEAQPRVAAPSAPEERSARIAGTFILGAVNIEGATVFTAAELAKSFEPYLASRVGQAELNKIVADITNRYRSAGYLLSYAVLPVQSVQSGIVNVRVVEGYVANVRVEGDARSSAAARSVTKPLLIERPLRAATLERALGLARDVSGALVTDTRLSRSPEDSSRYELTIVLGADRIRGLAYSDNRGTIDGARMRGYGSMSIASLVVPGDQLQLDLFAIPSDKFRFFYGQLKAGVPIGSDGLRFTAYASRGDQRQELEGPDQNGKSRQLTAELSYPFVKSRVSSVIGHASLSDWKSSERRAGEVVQRDRLQVARVWAEIVRAANIRIDGRIGFSQGLDLGPATEKGDPLASRPFGSAKFTKLNADMQVTAPLGKQFQLRLDSSAQLSTRSLLAPEEFALGGSRIGRGFDFNTVTGDHGIGAMVELGYRIGDVKGGPKALEMFAFADGGGAFRKRSSPGLPKDQWLAGVGAGARLSAFGMTWSGELGIPLKHVNEQAGVRAFFSIARPF